MARIETWFEQDLQKPLHVHKLDSTTFNQDNQGNLIGVKVFNNGSPVTLSGSVTGYCILADNTTVPVAGTRSGNQAYIILPQTAYSVPGVISITVKLTDGSAVTTLAACVGVVVRSRTDSMVNPGSVVQDWTQQISEAMQNVQNELSRTFKYNGMPAASENKSADDFTENGFIFVSTNSQGVPNISGIPVNKYYYGGFLLTYRISNAATVFTQIFIPQNYERYPVIYRTFFGGKWTDWAPIYGTTIDNEIASIKNSLLSSEGKISTIESDVPKLFKYNGMPAASENKSADDFTENGFIFVSASSAGIPNISNIPTGYMYGWLMTYRAVMINYNIVLQIFIPYNSSSKPIMYRTRNAGTWGSWIEIGNGKSEVINNTYNNTYVTEHYDNEYTITCNPTIKTDTNNYLSSSNDTTDMTGAIQTMLTNNKICQLGPGNFYVRGITIPNNSTLRGCGNATTIILAGEDDDAYAVKLQSNSCIKDVRLWGSDNPKSPQVVGSREGIIFEGNADQTSGTTFTRSAIENVWLDGFSGSGVKCYNTGLSYNSKLHVSNCYIYRCGIGINVQYYSEFHRFTNVSVTECLTGAVVNGGNCNFSNCDFSGNVLGLLIDDSLGQSRNNSHGTFSACSFNHSGGNSGTAIRILGADNGEIFTGCQIFYGGIEIDNSIGIRFIGANMGNQTPIKVTNSKTVIFSDCTFKDSSSSPVTSTGNTAFLFHDCYKYDGTQFAPV